MQFMTKEEALKLRECSVDEGLALTNEILSRVHNKTLEDAFRQTPDLMIRLLASQQAQKKQKEDFYNRNPDFKEHVDIVQATIQQVEAANSGKNYDFILGLAEPMIRSRISKTREIKQLPMDKPAFFNPDGKGIL